MLIIYSTEKDLVDSFLAYITGNPWDIVNYGMEFNYMRGRADVVAFSLSNELIAIEAKLSRWRIALQQAFRNKCFADKSYVLLPDSVAKVASRYEYEFDRRGIGICCIQDGHICIVKEAIAEEPIQPWLRQAAIQYVMGEDANYDNPMRT